MAGAVLATLLVKIGAQVDDVKKGVDKVTRDLEGVKTAAEKVDKAISGAFSGIIVRSAALGTAIGNLAAKMTAAFARFTLNAVTDAFSDAIRFSSQLQNSLIGLGSVANAFGTDVDAATTAAKRLASDGLLSVADAATGLKNLLAAGFNLDQATQLMNAFKDSAAFGRQSALSFGDAVRSATEGVKNGNSILVDNAGVTKNLSQILKEAGFSAQDLSRASSDAGVRMALFNGIIKETGAQIGHAVKLTQTYTGQVSRLEAQYQTFLATLGDSITQNRNVAQAIAAVGDAFAGLTSFLSSNRTGLLIVSDAVLLVVKSLTLATTAIDLIQTQFNSLIVVVAQSAQRLVELGMVAAQVVEQIAKVAQVIDPAGYQRHAAAVESARAAYTQLSLAALSLQVVTRDATNRSQAWGDVISGVNGRLNQLASEIREARGQTISLGAASSKSAVDMGKIAEAGGDLGKAFQKLQDKVRGVDLVRTAREWEKALKDPMNVALTFADDALSEQLRDALDAVVIKFGDLETAGVGAMQAIHDAVRRRLTPAIREGVEGIKKLPGEFLSAFDAFMRPGEFTIDPRQLPGATGVLPRGLADVVTHPFRDAFVQLGQDLPGLIFGAIERGQSVIGTIAAASAGQFMKIFTDAIARINRTPGGGRLTVGERLAGLAGVGLQSLAQGIALGGQTTSLLTGGLAGAATGALGGLPLAAATGGLSVLVGGGVGLVGGLIGAAQGKKNERRALEAAKAQFEAQFGGIQKLRELAEKAGFDLDAAFNAKSPEAFNQAIKAINGQLAAYNKHLEGLQTALNGVNQRAQVFANNFSDLIARRDELTKAGTGGSELESINAKIAEVAQRTQPEFERLGLMVRDTFAGLVRESGDAVGAITALAPAFQVLKDGVEKFGLTSTAAIDELLKSFNLLTDEAFAPFFENIQASGQVLKGLFDAKALSPEGFQAIAADIGQSFQEIVNRGGDIGRALALNQPILQTLWEAQQRFGAITDQTTQSILAQAEAQGLVGEHMKSVNDKILDVLIAIGDVLGAKIPEALRNAGKAAKDTAEQITDAIGNIDPPVIEIRTKYIPPEDMVLDPDPTRFHAFATGGIVRRPTLALIGEAGPEAVVPLDRLASVQHVEGAAQAGSLTVNIYGDVDSDERAERMVREFARQVRLGGASRTLVLDSLGVR